MTRRGRKPQPTSLKILNGVRESRINRQEPTTLSGIPDPPVGLSVAAAQEWRRLAAILSNMGVLTVADADALRLLCEAIVREREAVAQIASAGYLIVLENSVQLHPLHRVAEEARRTIMTLLAEFGITPSSRSRIKLPATPQSNPLQEFLAQNPANRRLREQR